MFRFVLVLGVGLGLTGCAARELSEDSGNNTPVRPDTPILDALESYLSGTFNSQTQSEADAQYYAIQLTGCSVEAPELGDRVLYIEQASMSSLASPYRQRLYVLHADETEGTAETEIYALTKPDAAIGLCADDERPTFRETDVSLRAGCGVFLTWEASEAVFNGGTRGEDCSSTLGGATYATSEVWMRHDQLLSWDRGYFENGQQAWGATAGPYEFNRQP